MPVASSPPGIGAVSILTTSDTLPSPASVVASGSCAPASASSSKPARPSSEDAPVITLPSWTMAMGGVKGLPPVTLRTVSVMPPAP